MARKALMAMIHLGKSRLGLDDPTYRDWLAKYTGKRSCKDCSERELSRLADELRQIGALDKPGVAPRSRIGAPGGRGADRPTQRQWDTALGIARRIGMSGDIDDPAFVAFTKRQAKVEHPRFIDRDGMHALITGLHGWLASRQKHAGK